MNYDFSSCDSNMPLLTHTHTHVIVNNGWWTRSGSRAPEAFWPLDNVPANAGLSHSQAQLVVSMAGGEKKKKKKNIYMAGKLASLFLVSASFQRCRPPLLLTEAAFTAAENPQPDCEGHILIAIVGIEWASWDGPWKKMDIIYSEDAVIQPSLKLCI